MLFVTDQQVQVPVQVELYTRSGELVGTHSQFSAREPPLPNDVQAGGAAIVSIAYEPAYLLESNENEQGACTEASAMVVS